MTETSHNKCGAKRLSIRQRIRTFGNCESRRPHPRTTQPVVHWLRSGTGRRRCPDVNNESSAPDAHNDASPEHTFLTTSQVFQRYRWGRTRGYEIISSTGFPPRIGGSFRLDTLLDWEERELATGRETKAGQAHDCPTEAAADATASPRPQTTPDTANPDDVEGPHEPLVIPGRRRTRGVQRES
jgi:hypothetical protein